jgi:hypothetical protein
MLPYWEMVEAINGGAETIRAAGDRYLPRMTNESEEDYRIRRGSAPFTKHIRRYEPQSCVKAIRHRSEPARTRESRLAGRRIPLLTMLAAPSLYGCFALNP